MTMSPEALQKLLNGPAMTPPKGVKPNFVDPPNMNKLITVLLVTGIVIAMPMVVIRLYTKWVVRRKVLPEDILLICGFAVGLGLNAVVFMSMPLHYGAHQWNIQYKNLVKYLLLAHVATLLFCIVMLLLRLTIIIQIMRAFVPPRTKNFTYWAGVMLIFTNASFWACLTFIEVFACRPRAKLWNPILPGKCLDRHASMIASAIMNLTSELLILVLPQKVIWNLSMTKTQRMGLSCLFLLGIGTCASSTLRLIYTVKLWPTNDITYFVAKGVTLWTIPEVFCCILVPCLPVLPQFIKMIKRRRGNSQNTQQMFQVPTTPEKRVGRERSFGFNRDQPAIRKTTETIITDIEYHELMYTNVSENENMEYITPWIKEPGHAMVAPPKAGRAGTVSRLASTIQRDRKDVKKDVKKDAKKDKPRLYTSLP